MVNYDDGKLNELSSGYNPANELSFGQIVP